MLKKMLMSSLAMDLIVAGAYPPNMCNTKMEIRYDGDPTVCATDWGDQPQDPTVKQSLVREFNVTAYTGIRSRFVDALLTCRRLLGS